MLETLYFIFFEFVKTGLFTFGGGYASLPFLYQMAEKYHWFSLDELTQLIAIAGITPGPIGLNMATFAGFKTFGFFGALIASFALILPMIIIASRVFKLYKKFSENMYVKSILYVLRPTSCALICAVAIRLFYNLILKGDLKFLHIDYMGLVLVVFLFILTFRLKRDPAIYMLIAGIFGAILYFCK